VILLAVAYCPSYFGAVRFVPPAVQNRAVKDAVNRGFHAAGAGRFHRAARGVKPHVSAGSQVLGDVHVVVFDKHYSACYVVFFRKVNYLADKVFARHIVRVRLSGENQLNGAVVIPYQLKQAFGVAQKQVAALVSGKPARETKGERVGRKGVLRLFDASRARANILRVYALAHKGDKFFSAPFMGAPQLFVGDAVHAFPNLQIGRFVQEIGAEIPV